MSDRNRRQERESQDWASQVPRRYGPRGPYEDYGWEPGESVLPEFRDPSVHEMPYERERYGRQRGDMRQGRSGGAMDAQRRGMMQNPYDSDYDHRGYGRGYDYDRGRYERGGGEGGWRGSQGSYGGMYNRDYDYGRDDENRWRAGGQGTYGRDYGDDENRWRTGSQGTYGRDYGYDYDRDRMGGQGSSGYDYDRGRMGGQGSSGGYGSPATWSYTEYWLIPGPFTGRGPKGYQRSDERIREDVCERLTQHGQIDAGDIEIDVSDGQVTLRGTVDSRQAKRMAEDAAESVSGARDVRNELRVKQDQGMAGQGSASSQGVSGQGARQREVGGTQNRG